MDEHFDEMYDEDGPRAMAQARLPPVLAMEAQTPGPLRIPGDLQALIRRMASENPIWGEQRIADELRIKLGLRVSPRTVGKYLAWIRPTPHAGSEAALESLHP